MGVVTGDALLCSGVFSHIDLRLGCGPCRHGFVAQGAQPYRIGRNGQLAGNRVFSGRPVTDLALHRCMGAGRPAGVPLLMAPLAIIGPLVYRRQGGDFDHIIAPVVAKAIERIVREKGLRGGHHHGGYNHQKDEPNTVLWHGRPLLAS
jgi:hypothetical protein